MGFLFGDYALLIQSDLFDADYYRANYPDVVKLNMDPLTHYLEQGCREQRNPSSRFDTSYYLEQCRRIGDAPGNALLHYLTVGARRGLVPAPTVDMQLHVDVPGLADGQAVDAVQGGVLIAGWAHSRHGIESVEISTDGKRVTAARLGLYRPDIPRAFPNLVGAGYSGYSAHIPPAAISAGTHEVTVCARDAAGSTRTVGFQIQVRETAEHVGPWNLRTRISLAYSSMAFSRLEQLQWRPVFSLVVTYPTGAAAITALHRTLASLAQQVYTNWRALLVQKDAPAGTRRSPSLTKLLGPHADLGDRITMQRDVGEGADLVMVLAAGDQLGADALLDWALVSGMDPEADLLYCDDRRPNPVDGLVGAFFKPGWSPDLLLATNYLGRAWCARQRLVDRTGLALEDLADMGAYDTALRLSESAKAIRNLPKLLFESSRTEPISEEKAALQAALKRRRVSGSVRTGRLPGQYHVARPINSERVSIIIPTEEQSDAIRPCIEKLRALTRHRNYEILCVARITRLRDETRKWLSGNADGVIAMRESFSWSQYCNRAAAKAEGSQLLFMDDALEVIEPGWLDALLQHVQHSDVGAVGPLVCAQDQSILDAGVSLGADGALRSLFRRLGDRDPGYFALAWVPRNVSVVSGSCMLISRETFAELGGFAENLPARLAAADLCLRMRSCGLLNVVTPFAKLLQQTQSHSNGPPSDAENDRFRRRWSKTFALGDPYLNPNLTQDQDIPVIEREPFEVVQSGTQLFEPASIRRILIVKLDHIGDCVTALPAVRRLKHHFPDAKLTVLCASGTVPLWKAEPSVTEVLEFDLFQSISGLGKHNVSAQALGELARNLCLREFDLAIDMRKQPDARDVLRSCGARYRAGFDHQGRFPWLDVALEWDEDVPLRSKHGHVSSDLIALVDRVAQVGTEQQRHPCTSLAGFALPKHLFRRLSSKPFVCIHPSAGSMMRQWPVEHFANLIDLLLQQEQFAVTLIGTNDDSEIIAELLKNTERAADVINLVGRVPLTDLPGLLARAILFIGNNSGPHHIAASQGVPTVGIHSGVVDASEWGPLGLKAVALRRRMSCSPCFLEKPADCQRGMACLSGISVSSVFRICQSLLPPSHKAMRQ